MLNKKERLILTLLSETSWMRGLELVKQSNGVLKRWSIYIILSRLSDAGYVKSRKSAPENRFTYCITALGEKVLNE